MVRQKKIEIQGYAVTLLISALAIIIYCFPGLSGLFIYDRQAILSGELWRLFTAPFVHFSGSHIFWNVLVFSVAGFAVSAAKFPCFWIVCGLSISLPGHVFLLTMPDMACYGGFSGPATGAAAYFCLCSLFRTGREKGIWALILFIMIIKIFIESALGESIFAQAEEVPFRVIPGAHIAGYLVAIATVLWARPYLVLQEQILDSLRSAG